MEETLMFRTTSTPTGVENFPLNVINDQNHQVTDGQDDSSLRHLLNGLR